MLTIIPRGGFHLDAPFAALPPDKARARRAEQRELLDRLAGLAEERRADVVLLSGDLLDGNRNYQETVQALARTTGHPHAQCSSPEQPLGCYSPRSVYAAHAAWPDLAYISFPPWRWRGWSCPASTAWYTARPLPPPRPTALP